MSEMTPEESNRRLREQYSEIARLAGGLAHEVKNPLSTIRLNMDLLAEEMEDLPESPQRRRSLRKIETVRRETVRLEELLNDFLNFTRAHNLDLTAADVNRELREILEFFRPRAAEANVEIVEYFTPDLPTIRIDKRSFHRAIFNLLLNAVQSMTVGAAGENSVGGGVDGENPGENDGSGGSGGQLVVRTRLHGGEVAVDLIDTGCGMDSATIQKIFDPFFSTKQGGSGLGLPTVRKIIEGHGGRIAIQSEPNRGTQFTLTFPALPRLGAEEKPEIVILPAVKETEIS